DSVGISTLPILSSSPKARTRDSRDSLTLRSNPEYEWMMYHFILGLRGCSATAAAPSVCGAPVSVVPFFVSSCISLSQTLKAFAPQRFERYWISSVTPRPSVLSTAQKYTPDRKTVISTTVVV